MNSFAALAVRGRNRNTYVARLLVGMTVLVTGGRDYADVDRIYGVLDRLHAAFPIRALAQGRATGADMHAHHWCIGMGVPCRGFQAEWNRHGNSAGFIRNKNMFDVFVPDLVVAFPGGKGTGHMVAVAEEASRLGIWDGFIFEVTP